MNVLGFLTNRKKTVADLVRVLERRDARDGACIDMLRAQVEELEAVGAGLRAQLEGVWELLDGERKEVRRLAGEAVSARTFMHFTRGSLDAAVKDRAVLVRERNRMAADLERERRTVEALLAEVGELKSQLGVCELQVEEAIGGGGWSPYGV